MFDMDSDMAYLEAQELFVYARAMMHDSLYSHDLDANGELRMEARLAHRDAMDLLPAYSVSDSDAERWAQLAAERRRVEAKQERGRMRGAPSTCVDDAKGRGVAGLWAETDSYPDQSELVAAFANDPESPMVTREQLATETTLYRWTVRDRIDENRERSRRATGDQSRVSGDYWGTGPAAEKAWLDATLAQLRIEIRELLDDAVAKGVERRAARRSAQVEALVRQGVSLRHRHNFKRYVEALGCDPEQGGADFQEVFGRFDARRRAAGLSFEKATERLAEKHSRDWMRGVEGWVGVEGLIAA